MAETQTNYVICMKWGTQYGPEYVNILAAMAKRHLTVPYTFVCFTDDTRGIDAHIETRDIPEIPLGSAPIWSGWRKLSSLSPKLGLDGGTVLFLDLDVVIMENMDSFFTHAPNEFCIIENWTQLGQGIGNSSIYRYQANAHADVFASFSADPEFVYKNFSNEQEYLTKMVAKTHKIVWWPETWSRSFKRHCVPRGLLRFFCTPKPPKDCKILVFHGPPKPLDAARGIWAKDGGKRGKFLRPAAWIADHWRV